MARILIAEDEASLREFLLRGLKSQGHEVAVAGDGAQALERLGRQPFDLLLTDIVMPLMDGIELALKAAKDFPHLRIILMTGFAAERQRAHGLEELVQTVIVKPFSLDQICRVIDAALAAPEG